MTRKSNSSNAINKIISIYYYQLKMQLSYPFTTLNYFFLPFYFILPLLIFSTSIYDPTITSSYSIHSESDLVVYLLLGSTVTIFAIRSLHSLTLSLRKEMWMGTLSSLYLTPNPILYVIIGISLSNWSLSLLGILVQFMIISILYKLSFSINFIIFFCLLNILLSFIMFDIGIIVLSLTLTNKQAFYVIGFIETLMTITAPFIYSISVLPDYLRIFVWFNPMTIIIVSARNYYFFANVQPLLWNLILFVALIPAFFLISFFIFSHSQKKILKNGTLEFF